nr:SCO-spondin-like [Nothobranchius furzeri]
MDVTLVILLGVQTVVGAGFAVISQNSSEEMQNVFKKPKSSRGLHSNPFGAHPKTVEGVPCGIKTSWVVKRSRVTDSPSFHKQPDFSTHSAERWCDHVVEEKVDRVLAPRLQLEVGCSAMYQYTTQGWRLDMDRMRSMHGGDDGIALYYRQRGMQASCLLYKPPETESQMVNRTVRACCEGWGGPHCSQGAGVRGQCFTTWNCVDFPGVHNSSLMPMEQCCSSLWGLSWRNASDHTCLICTYTLLSGLLPL